MRIKAILSGLLMVSVLCLGALAQTTSDRAQAVRARETSGETPLVLGRGVGLFKVGPLLAQDDFENLENWVVQVQQRSGFELAHVEARDHLLDCLVPGRGCTVWFKEKLPTRVTITYDVLCPTHEPAIKGVQPRDINNFWMAADPVDPNQGLFDSARYTGAFGSYDKMHGYYASTGGGGAIANLTTRMRRYPREVNGKPVEHVALNDKDGKPGYLITPDKVMTVQLVAYDDVIQYIVDGKLNYQIGRGDRIQLEGRDGEDQPVAREAVYDLDRFPVYGEGYFGFRMVGTHHIYTNFKVYALQPDDAEEAGRRGAARARPTVRVSSLEALREAAAKSNQQIVLAPGDYEVPDHEGFRLSGSNNDVDLSGAYIRVPLDIASGNSLFRLTGDHITLRGGTLEDTYPDGKIEVTDFGSCTEDGIRAYKGAGDMIVENCLVKKTRGGIKLYMARSARVSNCQVLDCVVQGYSVPSGGVISNSSGNAAYGPLLYIHFDSHSNQRIDLKVFPSPHGLGDHPLAAIKGRGHAITFTQAGTFTRAGSPTPETLRPIVVGYPMRFDFLCVDYPDVPDGYEEHFAKYSPKTYKASGITIDNGTAHPVVLGKLSQGNTVASFGPIRDHGTNNTLTTVARTSPRQ